MLKIKILVIPIIVGILIIGTMFGLLATETWNPAWNPFQKATETIVEDAIAKLLTLDSLRITGNLKVDIQVKPRQEAIEEIPAQALQGLPESAQISLNFTSLIDGSDSENIKGQSTIDLGVGTEGMEFSLGGEIKNFGEDMYLKITTLPAIPFLSESLGELKNQWFKIEEEKLKELSKGSAQLMDKEKQKEILEDLKNLLRERKIFEIENDFGKEELNGAETKHYLVSFNQKRLKELIPELLQLMKKYIPEEQKADYEKDIQEALEDFPQKFDEAWEKIGGINFEVWIAKPYLKKVWWEREIDLGSLEEIKDKVEQGEVKIAFELNFSDFNKKFEIKAPEEFKPIEEAFSKVLPLIVPPASQTPPVPQETPSP